MATDVMPDPATPFGERVRRRLTNDQLIWLTTTGRDGTPQPNPVWFLWEDGDTVLIYNRPDANRLAHIRHRPQVSLNLDGDGRGGDIIVLTGTAGILDDHPAATGIPAYLEKYRAGIERVSQGPDAFAEQYSVPVRVHVTRVRGH
jgi:PPOX class probable F420-dependent enzyme